jgi:predicted RNA-binding Zn ribbon-like protein
MTRRVTPETIQLWGGSLCLDFVNSVDYDARDRPLAEHEALREPRDLARWARRLGVTPGRRLPAVDDDEFAAALALRTHLRAALAAVARGARPPRAALDHVLGVYAEATAAARFTPDDGAGAGAGPAWGLTWPAADARRVRFAVAADAVALLGDPARLGRLRRCPGRDCGWLFLDTSGRRRWCSMGACGSREKMRRMYDRRRSERAPAS